MKQCFLFTVLFFYLNLSAQNKNVAIVEYRQINNTEDPNEYPAILSVNAQTAIFQEIISQKKEDKKTLPEGAFRREAKISYDPYLKIDLKERKAFFFDNIGEKFFLVTDDLPNLKWEIASESKKIAGYDCVKATVSYRGRDWTAWFAPQIPLPFGPWKLSGLPGLILEATDATNRFAFQAVKVEFKKSELFSKDFTTLQKSQNKESYRYEQFLSDKEEFIDNMYAELAKKHNVTRNKIPRSGLELKYEWEQ